MKEGLIIGNLVQEYKIGNTRIKIYDSAYIGKSKDDVEQILKRIADIWVNAKLS
jgi:hypothetical protein